MNRDEILERTRRLAEKAQQEVKESSVAGDKLLAWYLARNFIMVLPDVIKMLDGDPSAAVLLARLFFWSNTKTARARDGWFYWSQAAITKETGLSIKRTRNARETLEQRCIVETVTKGIPKKVWWRVNHEEYFRQLRLFIDSSEDSIEDSPEDSLV